jgi:hypothetical protein
MSRQRKALARLKESGECGVSSAYPWARSADPYGTMNSTLLESVPPGVTTSTLPVVAPAGTVAVISELQATVNLAAVPLKLTLVAPVRSVPRMLMAAPTLPDPGCASTNGPKTDRHAEDRATDAGAALVFSDSAGPSCGRPVQGSTGVLDQRVWVSAVRVVEAVQRGQRATRTHLEDRAIRVGPATGSCSVEVPIGGLDQRRCGTGAVRAVEAVQRASST